MCGVLWEYFEERYSAGIGVNFRIPIGFYDFSQGDHIIIIIIVASLFDQVG